MISFLRLLLAFALAMALLPDWPADAASLLTAAKPEAGNYGTWILGLISGVVLTVAARIRWRDLPRRSLEWLRGQSARAGWATLGLCYAWILVFY